MERVEKIRVANRLLRSFGLDFFDRHEEFDEEFFDHFIETMEEIFDGSVDW